MRLADVVAWLDRFAPPHTAEDWDNVGLLVGDPAADVSRGLLCIDYTAAVAEEAEAAGGDLVLAYHPPVFQPLKRVTAAGPSALVYDAARRGVAVYSPHTAWDVAAGGTNDVLADVMGLTDRRPLRTAAGRATTCKLVTFVPAGAVDAVSAALFAAGAGTIGNYRECSYRGEGVGTFFANAAASPTVGRTGQRETVREVRVETVVPLTKADDVVAALKASHPYETPAFDLVALQEPPAAAGIGRVGSFAAPVPRRTLIDRVKHELSTDHVLVAGPIDGDARTAAVCAGAGGTFVGDVLAVRADVYLTGELRHHDALALAARGVTVLCVLHSRSERVTLHRLLPRLAAALPGVQWSVSTADVDPFTVR